MQRTTVGGILDRTLEITWLAAMIAVPVVVNVYSIRAFEGDKVAFLRSLALLALALWIAGRIEAMVEAHRTAWRQPLVIATVAVIVCALVSNVASAAPAIAFWGSYERAQGTYLLLANAVLFFAFISTATLPQVERLVSAALIASLAPCVYALIQVYGADPIGWDLFRLVRAHSTAGNPIFLGAFVILVMPLALARLLAALEEGRYGGALAYFGCLSLNAVVLACTQSRGPLLAVAVALIVFLLAAVARRRLRLVAVAIGAVVATLVITAVCVRIMPLKTRWDAPAALEAGAGNALVRRLVWEGTAELIKARPWSPFGSGLDTFRLVFPPFYSPALKVLEKRDAIPDRAHNDAFDTIVHLGFVGLLLRLVFLVALLKVLVKACGIVSRRTWYGVIILAAALASIAADVSFLGIAIGAGLLAALCAHLIWPVIAGPVTDSTLTASRRELLGFGLLAAVAAHLAEIQVGIPTAATELYLSMFGAAAVVLVRDGEVEEVADGDAPLMLGTAVAILLAVIVFMFWTPAGELSRRAWVIAMLLSSTWLGGLAITAASASARLRRAGVSSFVLVSLGGALAFTLPYAAWINDRPTRAGDLVMGDYITHFASVWYCGVFVLVLFGGTMSFLLEERQRAPISLRAILQAAAAPLLLVLAGWLVVTTNLAASRADMYAKLGSLYEGRKDWRQAAALYSRASDLQSHESSYGLSHARALLTLGTQTVATDPVAAGEAFDAAEDAAVRAWQSNPLETDNVALVARVNRRLAVAAAKERPHAASEADRFYTMALKLSPNRVALWQEYAELLLESDQPDNALGALDRAIALDSRDPALYGLRARACLQLERYEEAVAAYDSVLAIQPQAVSALTGKGYALTRSGRPLEAIEANLRALEIAPNDMIVRRSLAALYRDQKKTDLALEHARAALALAQGTERAQLEELVRELEVRRANADSAK